MIRKYFAPLLHATTIQEVSDLEDYEDLFAETTTSSATPTPPPPPPFIVQHKSTVWSTSELKCLEHCAYKLQTSRQDWNCIHFLHEAVHLHQRSYQECRAKFYQLYQAPLSTKQQSDVVQAAQRHAGRHWEQIAAQVGGLASPYSCFQHYQTHVKEKKEKRADKWTREENKQFTAAIEEYGPGDWVQIALKVPTRDSYQCQLKYVQPNVAPSKQVWSEQESKALLFAVKIYGESSWSAVSECIPSDPSTANEENVDGHPCRTPFQCKQQWAVLKQEMEDSAAEEDEQEEEV